VFSRVVNKQEQQQIPAYRYAKQHVCLQLREMAYLLWVSNT